jgi:acylphosphatase
MKKSALLTIHGHVQGVGFRYFVKQKADLAGICGFVKNLPDGSVYVEAEGESENLEQFIHTCRQGPSHAWVGKMQVQYCPVQDFAGFRIK